MATNNPLITAFVANNKTNEILISTSNDGVNWSGNTKVGQSSKGSPSLAFFNGKYWLAFRANNSKGDLLVCSSPDGVSWSGETKVNQSSQTAPSLAVFNNRLWMAFVSDNSKDKILLCSSANGEKWSYNNAVAPTHEDDPIVGSVRVPSLVVFGNKLWLAFVSSKYVSEAGDNEGAGRIYVLQLFGRHELDKPAAGRRSLQQSLTEPVRIQRQALAGVHQS
jgi:hypothetical protein